jgi:hypothetical protein
MKLPDKFVSYKDSILFKIPIVLDRLESRNYSLLSLYNSLKNVFDNNINEYVDVLTCLYALNKVDFFDGVITYVKND